MWVQSGNQAVLLALFPVNNFVINTCLFQPFQPQPQPIPPTSSPTFFISRLEHVLMLFICCFHVRMSAFTVNNWCGLSKTSKMHASSGSLEPFDQKNYAVTSDIISICLHSTQNHFELKINDLLLCLDCVFLALSTGNSRISREQEEAKKTWVNIYPLSSMQL